MKLDERFVEWFNQHVGFKIERPEEALEDSILTIAWKRAKTPAEAEKIYRQLLEEGSKMDYRRPKISKIRGVGYEI